MDPKHKLYLQELQQNPEEGFKQQFLVELRGVGKKFTKGVFDKIYDHYKTVSNTGNSVYYGMSSKQVNPNSEDFVVIEFLSTIEFWQGFFEEDIENFYIVNSKRVLTILDNIVKKTEH
jgi:hypothetical protein